MLTRLLTSASLLSFCFLLLLYRTFDLQVLKKHFYSKRVRESTTYILEQEAPRGIIYDRDKRVLASSKQSASLIVFPSILLNLRTEKKKKVLTSLSAILSLSTETLEKVLKKLSKKDSRPYTLQKNLSLLQVATIYEHRLDLPGIAIQKQAARYYLNNSLLAHVLGYTGKVSPKELASNPSYRLNDTVGKSGVEKALDRELRGKKAYYRLQVDRYGQPIEKVDLEQIERRRPDPGKNVTLTIDLDLQKLAEKELEDYDGAVVMLDSQTGEILVLASNPGFNPNLLVSNLTNQLWNTLNQKKVFINRAISAYPPGSIWKPLVILSALESGSISPRQKFKASGAFYLGRTPFRDWTSKQVLADLKYTIAWSRNTVLYQIARELKDKEHTINQLAEKFKIGQKTGVKLLDESPGEIPNQEWKLKMKRRNKNFAWYPGNLLHYSIGQGYLLMTPLQAARMTAGIANNGNLPKVFLVKQIEGAPPTESSLEKIELSPQNLQLIKEGMMLCVKSGTCQASKLRKLKVEIAGKTGSAENSQQAKTHAWYVAFGPYVNPKVVISVFLSGAGHGGSKAAPVARKLLEAYFEKYQEYQGS